MEMLGRFLFRQTWELGTDWDEPLNALITRRWKQFQKHMESVNRIRDPKSVGSQPEQIHIFCDASSEGYGACA